MSTTVTYKGDTLTTATNQTKVLETAGKYLEDDITITDVSSSAAIVVTEEPDVNGGIIKNITAVDISDTTAVASDVAQGKYFYTADGTKTEGSASGGGGGLEYEEGTWAPSVQTESEMILFQNTHETAPFYFMIQDNDSEHYGVGSSAVYVTYTNMHQFSGASFDVDGGITILYGFAYMRYTVGQTSSGGSTVLIKTPYTSQSDSVKTDSRYWAKETGIRAYCDDFYFRVGRTYKWIAVWAPTT